MALIPRMDIDRAKTARALKEKGTRDPQRELRAAAAAMVYFNISPFYFSFFNGLLTFHFRRFDTHLNL
jgi:transglutaminase-like putative cysteine protease